ncbi:hypothetical protein CSA80_04490 [Candidatus Saccharibacteria bacterium]|nr:MAG: hypothetical protein CR973_01435 [Candidatus Saccharibacteria bacterium]PID98926.1 MAG: hypothetical protein CSA80_04490 [Candidatus Saccharibacteria bacterium]
MSIEANSRYGQRIPVPRAVARVGAAVCLGLSLGACSSGGGEVSAEPSPYPTERPADGSVFYVGESTESPTDSLANQIARLQLSRDEATSAGSVVLAEMEARETGADTSGLGHKALVATIQFRLAQKTLPFPSRPEYEEEEMSRQRFQKAANEISNPEIRNAYKEIFESAAIYKALTGVRFDGMEQEEARKLLDSVKPGLSNQYSEALDRLDVSDAVITETHDPKALSADIADVHDPELRAKATQFANSLSGDIRWDLYDELTDSKAAKATAEAAKRTYYAEAYPQLQGIEAGELVDDAIRKELVRRNAGLSVPEVVTLPPLKDPARKIDLSAVEGPKKYYHPFEPDSEPLAQFAEIYAQNGKVVFKFEDGSNVSQESRAQLERIVDDVSPLLAHAFKAGDLVSVRFIIGGDYDPYFQGALKEAHIRLSNTDPLSEEQLRQNLVHELAHAMVDAAFGETALSEEEAGMVKNACSMLADEAYAQYNQALKFSPAVLQRLIDRTYGDEKAVFLKLKEIVEEDKLADIMGSSRASSQLTARDITWTDCAGENFRDLMVRVGSLADVSDPDATYEKILQTFSSAASSARSGDVSGSASSSNSALDDPDFEALFDSWDEAVRKESLFARLNESEFVRTDSASRDLLGHSRDSAHELMATVFDITLNNPEELKQLIAGLSPDQQEAVYTAIDTTYAIVSKHHPEAAGNLNDWKQQFRIQQ